MSTEKSNAAKGRHSFDITVDDTLIEHFNRQSSPYPLEAGGQHWEVPAVTQAKDVMLVSAQLHARQEYDRIMELVTVLQDQAARIKRRLEVTEWVHSAEYAFKPAHGRTYWLVWDADKKIYRLSMHGPGERSTGDPQHWDYLTKVQWLGDHTWTEVA